MFDWLSEEKHDPLALLKRDHNAIRYLFTEFEKGKGRATRYKVMLKAIAEIKLHSALEEEIFYPAIRSRIGKELTFEAGEEHHVADLLIAELEQMSGREAHYEAKFAVLAESVQHHLNAEEGEIFPRLQALDIDFDALGRRLAERRHELLTYGLPATHKRKRGRKKKAA
jgi:hemerythrin superfamily protein